LSQDEVSDGLVDFNEVQRILLKRLGDRVLKRPREYISPFKISRSRPEIPLAKVVYLRKKIASDPELRRYFLMLQPRLTRSCNHASVQVANHTLFYLLAATTAKLKLQAHTSLGCRPHGSQM
jgi:hypothetical protein